MLSARDMKNHSVLVAIFAIISITNALVWPMQVKAGQSSLTNPENDSISSVTQSEALVHRLKQLRNQFANNSKSLNLSECIRRGLTSSASLGSAYSSIISQEYRVIAKNRENYPTLSLQSLQPFLGKVFTTNNQTTNTRSEQRQFNPATNSFQNVSSRVSIASSQNEQYNQLGPYLTFNWSFFQPSVWAEVTAEKQELDRQKLLFNVSARGLLLNIQQGYYRLQANLDLINEFEKIYRINKQQVQYVETRMNAGLANISEVAQAKSQLFAQAEQLVGFYKQYFSSAYSLAYLLSLPENVIVVPADGLEKSPTWQLELRPTIQQALDLREEIKAYVASAKASQWNARASLRQYLPVISLQAFSYGYYEWEGLTSIKNQPNQNFESTYTTNSVGLGVNWNFFDSGKAVAQSNSQKAQAKSDLFRADDEKNTVVKQVRNAFSRFRLAEDSLFLANQDVIASSQFLEATQVRFKVGLSNMTSIVQAMQALGNALRSKTNALLDYNIAIAELYRYSGEWPPGTIELSEVTNSLKVLQPVE